MEVEIGPTAGLAARQLEVDPSAIGGDRSRVNPCLSRSETLTERVVAFSSLAFSIKGNRELFL